MPFGRGFQADRHRRVMNDVVLRTGPAGGRRTRRGRGTLCEPPAGRSENYGDAEFLDEQARLTDLIPIRPGAVALGWLAAAGVVAGLEYLYLQMPRLAAWSGGGDLEALDLGRRGALATWFSSLALALAALASVVIYTVRRYKRDDYRGHYRVWLWAALGWLLMSLDTTANLRQTVASGLVALSGTRVVGDGAIWWVIPYAFFLGAIGTRVAVDMRRCISSTATFVLAGGCYLVALAVRFGLIPLEQATARAMVLQGAVLSANLLLLLAMGLHARHVLLDARGMLRRRRRSAADEAEEMIDGDRPGEEEASLAAGQSGLETRLLLADGTAVTVHPSHGLPPPKSAWTGTGLTASAGSMPVGANPAYPPSVAANSFAAGATGPAAPLPSAPVNRKLTKQEKKALRARLERMRSERLRREQG